jgi:predicted Zn-dependent protease
MTHPLPENREAAIREEIAATGVSREGTVHRDEYLDMIDGLVWGPNPREGYFEGQRFLHPELAFELTFPTGWSTVNQRSAVGAVSPAEDGMVVMTVEAEADDPSVALRAFLSQEGISGGSPTQSSSGDIAVARAPFQAATEGGSVSGEIAFLRYGDTTFRILGYAAPAQWSGYRSAVGATISSFAGVTDPRVLGVEPMRLRIVRLPQASSLTRYVGENPQPVDVEVLARLNRVAPGEVVSAGTRIKLVEGTPVGN